MIPSNESNSLEMAIQARSTRRGLTADLTRMRYLNDCLFGDIPDGRPGATLYVGVGHGLDALLALQQGLTETIVGVDPYIGDDGNDDEDYESLVDEIDHQNLNDRFAVFRSTIEDYIPHAKERFDCIICNDVLHHIFVTEQLLTRSSFFPLAEILFRQMLTIAKPRCMLVISDVERHGLRPMLARCGWFGSNVNYRTKQSRGQWVEAATAGGWSQVYETNYVPWRLRGQRAIWSGRLGRFTLCDKYHLYLANKNKC